MTKKTLGYVELEWTCPSCSVRNPGPRKTCQSCGMPMPENVKFEQQAEEKIVTDAAKIKEAAAGPDIHCYYCGSRNAATAATCTQCGADLTQGAKRESGQVLGVHRDQAAPPVVCPSCGTENEANAAKCKQCGTPLAKTAAPAPPPVPKPKPAASGGMVKYIIIGVVALCVVLGMCLFGAALLRTGNTTGAVDRTSWERSIEIEALSPVEKQAWHDEIPADASAVGSCTSQVRRTVDEESPNSREICGTPYTIDSGSGYGEVTQDCKYEVYEDYCSYTVNEWRNFSTEKLTGDNFAPAWPRLALTANQREGQRREQYNCYFKTENGDYSYSSSDASLLDRCQIGSRWVLEVNTLGGVVDIQPQ